MRVFRVFFTATLFAVVVCAASVAHMRPASAFQDWVFEDEPAASDDGWLGTGSSGFAPDSFDYQSIIDTYLTSPDAVAQEQPAGGIREQVGTASWYDAAEAGTCTHRTLPVGTIVQVTNEATGASTTCRVAGWGPEDQTRILDLSRDAFAQIADPSVGVVPVRLNW